MSEPKPAAPLPEVRYRPATEADLPACEATWRDGLNDYLVPMGQYEIPADNPSLRLLHAHALATDPERFWVATRADAAAGAAGEPRADGGVIGFASAVRRGPVWFLSMLFVRPGQQTRGVGRELLQRVLPADGDDATLATATDAAQPISNGLYAATGIVPRLPMFNLIGRPTRPEALVPLPEGVTATRIDEAAMDRIAGLAAAVDELDATALGFRHPEDHAFVRRQGRAAFAYRDGRGDLVGYGYTSEVGRIGPLATRDPALHAPIVAHLLGAIEPRGASAIWISGAAAATMQMLVGAGLRIEGFPVLVCWSRPFADFARYVPISPGLL
ncbi:MAG: GNAT family N-acetyltransferase [Chloroflexi bacterium]|nr:GNAT family N-acetyltransferase [Chloroflexota bacterium]